MNIVCKTYGLCQKCTLSMIIEACQSYLFRFGFANGQEKHLKTHCPFSAILSLLI